MVVLFTGISYKERTDSASDFELSLLMWHHVNGQPLAIQTIHIIQI